MSKIKVGKQNILCPLVPVLVGANINGKPNYITIGWVGWLYTDTVSVTVKHRKYSHAGIKKNRTFSINQPTTGMIKELDYCGLVSGRNKDKSALFKNFYGELKTAPMIKECPVNIECRVIQTLERPIHTVFIGEINEVYVDESYLTGEGIDMHKLDPVLYIPLKGTAKKKFRGGYWRLGEYTAEAWEIGKDLKHKLK